MKTDMTNGNPLKMMLRFAIPLIIGNLFQQMYSMVDTVIVGKFVGTRALAAVGATGSITFFILGFVMGVTNGFTVLTAQKFGSGNGKEMRQTVGNAAILAGSLALLMTTLSMTLMRRLLVFMHTPEDIFGQAYSYIMIICAGIAATTLYNLLASILRALGNSRTPLYFLILSAVLNIFLDLAFILIFHMGVNGAAFATVIAQGVSGLCCLGYIVLKVPDLHLKKEEWMFRKRFAIRQLQIGIPMGLQFSITAIGSMMVQSALNQLGSLAIAAFTAATKIEMLGQQPFLALSSALSTFVAQNVGAGRLDRVKRGFHDAHVLGVIYAALIGLFLFTGAKNMAYLFLSEESEQVLPMVELFLRCTGAFFIPLYFVNGLRNGIQGMGYGLLPMCAGIVELLSRGIVAVAAAGKQSYFGVCMANPAAWIMASLFLAGMYVYCMKDMEKKLS